MSENYITIEEKLVELGIEVDSVNLSTLFQDLTDLGISPVGTRGGSYHPIYDNSEALDGALERCGVSLPKKEIEAAVEVKKRGRPKTEKVDNGDEAIDGVSE